MYDTERFEPAPGGVKLRCKICGRSGYESGPWMKTCAQPHDYECHLCDKRYPNAQALGTHRRAHNASYFCPACRKVQDRQSEDETIESYCEATGKNVTMTRMSV